MYRQQILGEFLHIYLSKAKTSSEVRTLKQREAASGNWLSMLPSLLNMTTALEAAVLAISTAKLGRAHSDSNLVRESLKFYIQAMWELQKALLDPKLMHRDGTLAACLLLIMYEVLECPDEKVDAWLRHTRGCAILFEARGPEAYTSEFEHQLFLTFRQVEVTLPSFSSCKFVGTCTNFFEWWMTEGQPLLARFSHIELSEYALSHCLFSLWMYKI